MPIYDLFEAREPDTPPSPKEEEKVLQGKDRFFSSLTARLFFFLLLIGDILWCFYSLATTLIMGILFLLTLKKKGGAQLRKGYLALKRSVVCAVALLITLFSPALGIMIACTYFLIYDKRGVEEIVPQSLRHQFQEFLE